MAENWVAIASDVIAAIAGVGFDVIVNRKTSGPVTPWDATATVTAALTCKAIDGKPRRIRIDGTSEIRSARVLLVAPGPVVPAQGDKVTVRGILHDVSAVEAVAPGGVDLLYKVELAS
jgi:hypothetical protein